MTKIEQPTSSKSQMGMKEFKKLIEMLEMGKNSFHIVKNLILQQHHQSNHNNGDHQDFYKALEHHSMVVLDTFVDSISMLKSYDFNGVFAEKRKREHLDHHGEVISLHDQPCKSELSSNQESHEIMAIVNGRRESSYKKRKFGDESREEVVTRLSDDGFAWRKYGQKMILHSDHPRHYYRCTHKNEQKCQATKQIQQISENPIKYKLIYHGNHTCNNNILKTSPYFIDSPEEHSSAFVLSFDRSIPVNPLLFPTSGSSDSYNLSVSNPVVEQNEVISVVGEDYSSATHTFCDNLEEDYSFIMPDFSELTDFLQSIFQ